MLRIYHNQTVFNALLIDDIDDGLPNKEAHRLGMTADPKAYPRDGYANEAKQSCYVPYTHVKPDGSKIPGFITLNQTRRVQLSAGKGKIAGLQKAGFVTVISMTAADLAAPVITGATTVTTNFVVTGTSLTSIAPDFTTVTFAQASGVTAPSPSKWTQNQILTAGGSITATTISIPVSAFTTAPVAGNTVTANADELDSNTFVST